ncbi:MAG: twin-arginine translocase TatA/TatE family subunit [Solirubrobacteraceae bacterium]
MMGLDNPIHIAFLLLIVLLVFGAKRLPEMGQSLGAGLRGFKDSLNGEPNTTHLTPGPDVTRVETLHTNHAEAATTEPPAERSPVGPVA